VERKLSRTEHQGVTGMPAKKGRSNKAPVKKAAAKKAVAKRVLPNR
jgi:hypothetical protein